MAFKLSRRPRKLGTGITDLEKIMLSLEGITFKDGESLEDHRPLQQKLIA
ncbi:hypothetical protein AB1286_24765 [Trinickia sp. NRRL B-1857]